MYEETYIKIKLWLFLFMSIFLFVVYVKTMPGGDAHDGAYMLHFFNILLSFVILVSIPVLNFQDYTKKDWFIAGILGILSMGTPWPIMTMSIIKGVCVFTVYLASKTLYGDYNTRMELFNATNIREFLEDLKWMLIVTVLYVVIAVIANDAPIQFNLQLNLIIRALGAGVSEEIIFRLFLFSVIVRVSKGEVESKFLAILIMALPFAVFHYVDKGVYTGFQAAFIGGIGILIIAIPITLLAMKRNVFTAIGAHVLINFFLFVMFGR